MSDVSIKFLKTFLLFSLFWFSTSLAGAFAIEKTIGPSGEAVPRFVSLKADEVNVRRGPGRNHKILWVFKKLGLPVKIVSEYENWREIEDQAGAKGWVFHSLLSRRRTGVTVSPKDVGAEYLSLLEAASTSSKTLARLGEGVIVHILSCTGSWCNIAVNKELKGYINQAHLWGLFAKEPL